MGLIEGSKRKYYLLNEYGEKAFSVIPLAHDKVYVGNLSGMHYRRMDSIKTNKELAEFIEKNNLVEDE
ncbi:MULTISPECIES: hypothetical protein [Staphylococcus]|uniref:Uncharacterized protein n=1 Tax=Staphylococcus agnetis TaxID=985762 RepID=A0AAW9YWR0_9STAP|nr:MULTISPECIES: hypothetical protein [Staphylococcus]NHM92460.1 hypothetical protein [Staphylococcus sp. 10602379]NJI02498.1 hypothetical protein [Staphylococcus agnetis]